MDTQKELFQRLKVIFTVAGIILLAIYFLSGIYTIKPNELGVIRRFGRMLPEVFGPGMHYRFPYPVDKLNRLDLTTIKRVKVGSYIVDGKIIKSPADSELERLSGDKNIAILDMVLQYKTKVPGDYLFSSINPDLLVSWAASSVILKIVGNLNIDEILTTGKLFIQNEVKKQTQNILDAYTVGIEIVSANLQRIEPPLEVADAFRDVTDAKADKSRAVNEAYAYRESILPLARGEAEKILKEAEAYKTETIDYALGDTKMFLKILGEYRKARKVTSTRLYLETMEKILPSAKIFAVDTRDKKNLLEMKFINP